MSASTARMGLRLEEEVDLRLAVGATAAWAAILLTAAWPASRVFGCGGAAALLGVALMIAGRGGGLARFGRLARWSGAIAAAGFCVALVLLPLAGRIAHARGSPLAALAREHAKVSAVLTLSADPVALAAKGAAGSARVGVSTDVDSVQLDGRAVTSDGSVFVLAPASGWAGLLPGQRVRVAGTLQPSLDPASRDVTMFAYQSPELLGRPPWWQRAAGSVRSSLRQAASGLPDDERGLLPGLIDGDTSDLDPVLADHFRTAGLTHLVAVSGTNCSILIGAVLLALGRTRLRPPVLAAIGAIVLLAFVVVARPSPSVLRAAGMATIALVALATGRPRSALPALSASVLALFVWQPDLAADIGFAMSVAATLALLVLAPGVTTYLRRRRVPAGVAEALAVAATAHLVTMPLVAAVSGQLSLVAIPANLLAEPVVAVTTIVGFAAAVVAPLTLVGGSLLAWVAGWPCRWLVWVADYFGSLPGATVPWPAGVGGAVLLLGVLLGLLALLRFRSARPVLAIAALVATVIQIPVRSVVTGWPPPGWLFVACDVGQGDGLVLNAGNHAAVEIDAGPDPVAMDRCLGELQIDTLALLVFTHYHLDHVGGIAGAARGRRVLQVISGPLLDPASGVEDVQRVLAPRGLTVTSPAIGTTFDVGQVHLDVLGPAHPFHDTHSDPNNSSLILRATIDGIRILLPGDAEIEAQQELIDAHTDLRTDVLKVAHHGSAYFDPDFVAATHARLAVISVGAHNDYGHPSPLALAALARDGMTVARTDQDGDVAVVGTASGLRVVEHGIAARAAGPGLARAPPSLLDRQPGRLIAQLR